jgi:hypothetical protein
MNPMEIPQVAPVAPSLKEKRQEAMQKIFTEIETIQGEGLGIERLAAVQNLYDSEVNLNKMDRTRAGGYFREQALAKLLEYYKFELEANKELRERAREIVDIFPTAKKYLNIEAANDNKFHQGEDSYLDKKFNVA